MQSYYQNVIVTATITLTILVTKTVLGQGNPFGNFMPMSLGGLGLGSMYPSAGNQFGFGGLPGLGYPPLNRNFAPPMPRQEDVYTAIAKHRLDENSQMRLTISERSAYPPGSPEAYHREAMELQRPGASDVPKAWYVQGTFLNSNPNMAGTYTVVMTTGGRTADGCTSQSLGTVLTSLDDHTNPFHGLSQGPYGQAMGAAGILPDRLIISPNGPTSFASTLMGVSRRQLAGAGLAACQYISNGYCAGAIPFCATVAKDNLPAMEVPMSSTQGNSLYGPSFSTANFFNPGGSFAGGQGSGIFGTSLAFSDSTVANNQDDGNISIF